METTSNKPNVLRTQVGGDHYAKYPIQPIEYIQANHLDFAQGNIVKLATRGTCTLAMAARAAAASTARAPYGR